jgi:predicted kinase
MPVVHLLSGLPCAGKTSYANRLRANAPCVLFTLDRWLITLFGKYTISSVGYEEHTRRVLACRELIWEAAAEFLQRSVDVVLDDGFFLREHRVRHADLAREIGATATIHFLDVPEPIIRARLLRRNADLPRFNFYIDADSLRAFVELYETPMRDEGADLVIVNDTQELAVTDMP